MKVTKDGSAHSLFLFKCCVRLTVLLTAPSALAPGTNRPTGQVQEVSGGSGHERETAGSYESGHLQL